MRLDETAEERAFRAEVRAFVGANLPDDIRQRSLKLQRLERDDYVRWQRILFRKGWAAPGWPVEYGGTGWNAMQRAIFEEECAIRPAPRQMTFGLAMLGPVLQKFGTDAQKKRFLPGILDVSTWWCQGYSEPGSGSDLASLRTRAVRDGDHYVVDGRKIWTSYAHWADWIFCLVRTSTEGKPQLGISFLLIDVRSPGVTIRPIRTLDGGADVNETLLEGVRVPVDQLVGEENKGWTVAKYLLGHERTASANIGQCARYLEVLRRLASTVGVRNGKPLIEDPSFRARIAELEMDFMAQRWTLLRAISREADGEEIVLEPSVLKLVGSDLQQRICELMMECAGPDALPYSAQALVAGSGVETPDDPILNALAANYFDMRKLSIFGGSNEIQRNIIGTTLIG